MISVTDLHLSLSGNPILHGLNFTLEDGHNLVILGRSGSGKTVLVKTIMGFFKPDIGDVMIDGESMYSLHDKHIVQDSHRFAMVFQNSALLDSFTVFQNVSLPLYARSRKEMADARVRVEQCLAVVGLEHTLDMFPSDLSGGMRKRVAIARALVYNPKYVVFDEPLSGLDPITAAEIRYYINQIVSQKQVTVITITHETLDLSNAGDKVLFMEAGKCLYYGDTSRLRNTDDAFIRKFMRYDHAE